MRGECSERNRLRVFGGGLALKRENIRPLLQQGSYGSWIYFGFLCAIKEKAHIHAVNWPHLQENVPNSADAFYYIFQLF